MRTLFVIYFLIHFDIYAQERTLLNRIENDFQISHWMYIKKYDSVVKVVSENPNNNSLIYYSGYTDAANASFYLNKFQNGFNYLRLAIKNQEFNSVENMKYNIVKNKFIDTFSVFKNLSDSFLIYYNTFNYQYNKYAFDKYSKIFNDDQQIREIYNNIDVNNIDSQKSVATAMNLIDSINAIEFVNLINKLNRYPGINDIGKSNVSHSVFVLKHISRFLDLNYISEMIKKTTQIGEILNSFGPFFIDKTRSDAGKKNLYGMINSNAGDTIIYNEIEDINNIDKRRAEFLLPPLWRITDFRNVVLPNGYEISKQAK